MTANQIGVLVVVFTCLGAVILFGLYMIERAIVEGSFDIKTYNGQPILTPWTLHKGTQLNIVACWVLFILARILDPIGTILFLCVVGRKQK